MTKNPGKVNSMCFEILGFDVLIDDKLKPWLIEINHAPSFSTDTPLDFKMKKDVIADALQLLGMTHKRKKNFIKSHKSNINKRMLQLKKQPGSFKDKKKQSELILSPTKVAEVLKPADSESDVESPDEMEYKNKY